MEFRVSLIASNFLITEEILAYQGGIFSVTVS
jgi:hypothetical protein